MRHATPDALRADRHPRGDDLPGVPSLAPPGPPPLAVAPPPPSPPPGGVVVMSPRRLQDLLGDIFLAPAAEAATGDVLHGSWASAEAEAVRAYETWRATRKADDLAIYRACTARADAAQDALARRATRGAA